ncbi:MAG: sugar phosphate isomerase/epimerase [Chitinivibrionia bacterium]|nr:sugar phosphate isomerase/epimerase [Chitinivibrionia bacterium]
MKFAFSSNAFRKYSLEETIRILSEVGFQGIEIMADTPHAWPSDLRPEDRKRIRRSLEDHGMEISNINAFMMCAVRDFHHPSWIERDETFRKIRIQHTIDCLYLAADLGAKTISTEPGGPLDPSSVGGENLGGGGWEEGLRVFIDGVRQVTPHVRETGVKLLVEPEPGLLIQRSGEFRRFIAEMDPETVGMNFDVGHFFCVGESPETNVETMWPWIGHFHLEDIAVTREHIHLALGEGAVDLRGVLDAIRRKGYPGYATVELYPYQEDPADVARRSLQYLRTWESGHAH